MSGRMNREAYARLIAENIAWCEAQPRTLERDHVIKVLRNAVDYEYGPETAPRRPETGPMRFGDDWTGVFLRGDYAVPMAMCLEAVLDAVAHDRKPSPVAKAQLRGLVARLASADEREPVTRQEMRDYQVCVKGNR